MASQTVVEVVDVEKRFKKTVAVTGATLRAQEGQVLGLIGPSGCGKTTLVQLMVGLLKPTEGTVRVLGVDPVRFTNRERQQIGYMPQGFFLYPNLTVMQNMGFVAGLYGIGWLERGKRIRPLLEYFDLWEARNRQAQAISGGMQRRLELACALIHRPRLLFIDEPTAGLDPERRQKTWEYVDGLREQNVTTILTTQYLEEAEHCDMVVVLNDEKTMVAAGSPADLRKAVFQGEIVEFSKDGQQAREPTFEDVYLRLVRQKDAA
jgi:ABC-2 type transport system ATP-binding protein